MLTSNWRPPTEFPDLSGAKLIALDTETRDPNLKTKGPGGVRGDGYIVGISLATDDGFAAYYPIRHEGGDNCDAQQVLRYAKDQLRGNQPKVGARLIYDLEWLRTEGIAVGGKKIDIQTSEPLLNEDRFTYKLDALAADYLGEQKDETLLRAAAESYDIKPDDVKANLWRLPARYVGPYGTADAVLPIKIWEKQKVLLEAEDLMSVFDMESRLTDLLLEIRFRGIRVDVEKAVRLRERLLKEQKEAEVVVRRMAGREVDIWSGTDIAKAAKDLGLEYQTLPPTAKMKAEGKTIGNPTFAGEWLDEQETPFYKMIAKARKLDRSGAVFVEQKILAMQHRGRVHPLFNQVRREDNEGMHGTRTGRFSSEKPNMQQIPARDPYLAPLIRGLFIPEDGCRWASHDYAQQEPRVTVHYAYISGLPGSAEAHRRYNDDPSTDYHSMVADMAQIVRKDAKTLNLGLAYGMGKRKLAEQLGRPYDEAMDISDKYHQALPFMKMLGEKCKRLAEQRGWIRTLLGRRRHFNLWGPPRWKDGAEIGTYQEAVKLYGEPVTRYFVNKAMNSLIQGSSADMIKKAMLDCYDAGYVIALNIHDELNQTDAKSDAEIRQVRDIMLNCVKLEVPLKVDTEVGPSWGEAEEVKL